MNQLNGTDLAAMHTAIVTASAAAFPGVHFEFYRQDRKALPFGNGTPGQNPAAYCLLELSEMDASEFDPGTTQQAVAARFEAQFVIKSMQDNARVTIRALAGSYAAFLRRQSRWPGVLNGSMRVVGVYKDDFSPELDQFEVWRVEWVQDIWLGAGVDVFVVPGSQTASGNPELLPGMPAPTVRPTQPLFSFVPLVSAAYEPEYQPVIPPAP